MTSKRTAIRSRLLAALLAAAPCAAAALEPAVHGEATFGVDTNPLREARGEQGAYPFLGTILDLGLAYGGERTQLRAALSEGARLFLAPEARDADMLASRLDLDGTWSAGEQGEVGATLALRDLSERGGVRSETGGTLRVDSRVRVHRFDVETNGGFSVLYPRTSLLEDFLSVGPDAGIELGFAPRPRQRVRIGWELRARRFPKWAQERWDVANGLVLDWSQRGTIIAGGGYGLTVNQSSVPGGAYVRHRIWVRAATELPWEVTLAAQGSLQWSNYPGGLISQAERLLAENDERENALELRFSRPIGHDFEAVLKVAAYGSELSAGAGAERLPYSREVVQLSIGWRPE
jgi:hypothetical protein